MFFSGRFLTISVIVGILVFTGIIQIFGLRDQISTGVKGQNAIQMLDAMRRPFLLIKEAENRLGDGEGPIHDDIDNGSAATNKLSILSALLFVYLIGLIFIYQAAKSRETNSLVKSLESKNAELERFVYTVSHELKSPLVTISGFAGMLGSDVKSGNTDKVESDIEQITSAIGTMSTLLAELVELSRIGRVVNPAQKFNFGDLVRDAVKSVSFQIAERDVEVKILPDLADIYGDRARLLEVMQNLVNNSIKFMGDQSEPRIEIGSRNDGPEAICYVRDNGAGIDPSYHEKIFSLFDRLNLQIEGTGVGLALARRIGELHGGRIWVESEGLDKGSSFFFTIPRAT
ncbi:MAG: hypothetical protein GY815_11665 [Gammaproteobacteria bacterium]|nr:hypothetical protein [Gammaproteobacteria bacterium]